MSTPKQTELATNNATKHTPLPWHRARNGNIVDRRGCIIASIEDMPGMYESERDANGALILTACNSYAANQARIAELESALTCIKDGMADDKSYREKARSVLTERDSIFMLTACGNKATLKELTDMLILALPAVEESEIFDKPKARKLSAKIRALIN